MDSVFTEQDLQWMLSRGIQPETADNHLRLFKKGGSRPRLIRPALLGNGIDMVPDSEKPRLIRKYEQAASEGRLMAFVPASGVASRMFQDLSKVLYDGTSPASLPALKQSTDEASQATLVFIQSIRKFAFYHDLVQVMRRDGLDLERQISTGDFKSVLLYLLTGKGLNYAQSPKAMLKFHRYENGNRTALEEHLVEAARLVVDKHGICRVHVTMTEEHLNEAEVFCATMVPDYQSRLGVRCQLAFSIQSPSSDTLAVDLENIPFRDHRGLLLFRPGGHGALLENLNRCGGDIALIKNSDNVVPDHLKGICCESRKVLCGYLLDLQEQLFTYLRLLSENGGEQAPLESIAVFAITRLHIALGVEFGNAGDQECRRLLFDLLNRPLRVCGMVRNQGEPGGGPFWVIMAEGRESLQIVESAQVDFNDEHQARIWNASTHFNPVNMVCGIRDYRGRPFDLKRFVDHDAVIISRKSFQGKPLKALELPGLWNGSMARWNTIFVEVLQETFNPVKVVNDLLRKEHQPL
jgi:hypothetical protein